MCKIILYILCLSTCVGLLFSCKTSNQVVSGGFLSKRKYNKGWYSDFKQIKSHAALSVKPSAEVPTPPDEELKTKVNENEAEELVSLQSELPTTVLGKNKAHYSVTLPLGNYTPKITQTNTTKKQEEEQPELEKKKTNPYALYSMLCLLWAPAAYSVRILLISQNAKISFLLLLFANSIFLAILAPLLFGFIALKKKKERLKLYKNNGLAIFGIILGLIWAFAYFAYTLYITTGLYSKINLLFVMYIGYHFVPFIIALYVFYFSFFKKEKAAKPEPTKEEKEKLKSKLEKQTRFALILLFSGLLLALVLLLFPMFFLQALPKNMDFYLFLFACLLFLTGTFKYISSLILKRKYKK